MANCTSSSVLGQNIFISHLVHLLWFTLVFPLLLYTIYIAVRVIILELKFDLIISA